MSAVRIGPNRRPEFLMASPIANIPDPIFTLMKLTMVSRYLPCNRNSQSVAETKS